MAKFFESLGDDHIELIQAQPMFFIATAARDARINLSPKGLDTFRVLGPKRVGYLDLTGSGNETAAHLAHDGRVTIMFCSFGAKPVILRIYGRGRSIKPRDDEWTVLRSSFPEMPGARQLIVVDVDSVQTSCGYAVPHMTLEKERPTLTLSHEKKGPEGIERYWREKNHTSIDGLASGLLEDS